MKQDDKLKKVLNRPVYDPVLVDDLMRNPEEDEDLNVGESLDIIDDIIEEAED